MSLSIPPPLLLILALLMAACATPEAETEDEVFEELGSRAELRLPRPELAAIADGISEDEAIALALADNPSFREALADLGLSRAELVQAGILPNPSFQILSPAGPKATEITIFAPLEALFLRSRRVEAAQLEVTRVTARLAQVGLDLIRDVRAAYAGLRYARRSAALFRQRAEVLAELAAFDRQRLAAGDISEFEAQASAIAALDAPRLILELERAANDAEEQVRALIGFAEDPAELSFVLAADEPAIFERPLPRLLTAARAARPDLWSARSALESARELAELSRRDWLAVMGLIDFNKANGDHAELGPGLRFDLPIFHQGQGGQARALAELERRRRALARLRHGIASEVRRAHASYTNRHQTWTMWAGEVLPEIERSLSAAEAAFEAGDIANRPVLQARDRLLQARDQEARLRSEFSLSEAELERSLGCSLDLVDRYAQAEEG